MKLERNKNLDIIRAVATLLVVVYHSWVLTGKVAFRLSFIQLIISLGGELGVTAFFLLSGYGIYCSIYNSDSNGEVKFVSFMKKRCQRIIPAYWFHLLVILLIGSGAAYLSRSNWANLLTHVFLIHNLFPGYAGSINGVLWTIGVTAQFYVFAIPLYKGIKKFGYFFSFASIIFTIMCKAIMYSVILPASGTQNYLEFFAGRQLITVLDNFVIGMMVADIIISRKKVIKSATAKGICIVSIILLYAISRLGLKYGIHTNNISGYVWHSALTLIIGTAMFAISFVQLDISNLIYKVLIWVSRCEYNIYLWHMVIMYNLIERAPFVTEWLDKGYFIAIYTCFTFISIIMGYLMAKVEKALHF